MLRALLLVILPIALPTLLYLVYLKFLKRPAAASGAEPTEAEERARQRALFWVVLATAVMAVAAFASLRLSGGVAPGVKLEAPRLIDGKIVPSRPVE
ncbi:MAG TPA: hypothetical protein VGA60_11440 [Kiloniellales bacterium]|jgi:hypothetical protein